MPLPSRSCCRSTLLLLIFSLILTACSNDTEQTEELIRKAQTYLAKDNTRAAVIELKNALQLSPDNATGRNLLGQIYLGQGQGLEALKELNKARELGAKDPLLSLAIVRAMLLSGLYSEALVEIKASGKSEADWRILEGNAQLGLEAIDPARVAYSQALEMQADSPAAQRGLARIAMLTGDNNAAQGYISKALDSGQQEIQTLLLKGELEISLKSYNEAESTFLKVLELKPGSPAAHLGAARALLAQEKPDQAGSHISALETLKISGPQVSYLKALVARLKDNPDQAISALRDVLKVIPDHGPSLLLLGQIRFQRRELDQAQNRLAQFVAKSPNSAVGRKLLAAVYLELNQADKAIATLAPVEQALPDDAQSLSLLGTAYMQKGDFEKGKEYLKKAKTQAPKAAAISTQLAISQLATGQSDAAIKELEEAISQDPGFERADYLVIMTYLRKGDTAAAMAAVNNLIDKDPDNPIAHNLLGAVHEVSKAYPEARIAYQRVLEMDPKSKAAMLNLARLDIREKKLSAATQQLEAVLKDYPDDAMALMGLARLASDQGDGKQGLEYLQRARKANPQALQPRLVLGNFLLRSNNRDAALELALEAQSIAPDNPASQLLLARAQLAKGQIREAVTGLEKLVQLAPKSAMVHFYLAMAQQQSGAADSARTSLTRALELEPGNALILTALGQLENRSGNTEAAEKIADQLAVLLPDAPVAEELRGDIFARQGQWSAAGKQYQLAIQRNENSTLIAKLFSVLRRGGQQDKARTLVTQWLDKYPDDLTIRLLLASVDQQEGSQDQAIANYEAILKRAPEHAITLNNLAWLYNERKDKRALDYARRAFEGMPERAEIIDTYGWMLLQDGQTERALQLLDKAVRGAPNNGDIRYHRAVALNRAGDSARARSELEDLLAGDNVFPERDNAQALLDKLNSE